MSRKQLSIFFKNHNYDNRIEFLNALLNDGRIKGKPRKSTFSEIDDLKEFCLAKVYERKEKIEKLSSVNDLKMHTKSLKYSQIFYLANEQFCLNTNLGTFRKYLMRLLLQSVERNKVLKEEKEAKKKNKKRRIVKNVFSSIHLKII